MSTTIADVKCHVPETKSAEPFWWSFNQSDARGSCVVEIITEDGTSGWGECFGPSRLNAAIVSAFKPLLIGVPIPDGPGLGIEINRDVLAEFAVKV